jgi:peptide deformylase
MSNYTVIKRAPYKGLLKVCKPVVDIPQAHDWMVQMSRIVHRDKLEGLSANQIGINKQAFVTNVRGDGMRFYINPTLTITDYDMIGYNEQCASYPRNHKRRQRYTHVIVDFFNWGGERVVVDTMHQKYRPDVALRLSARIQHEMEHVNGINVRKVVSIADMTEEDVVSLTSM